MEDKRASKRRHIVYYLKIYNIATKQLIGFLCDISPGGLLITSESRLRLHTDYKIGMKLPDNFSPKLKVLPLNIRVLWMKKDKNPKYMIFGCRLLDVTTPLVTIINQLIAVYGFNDGIPLPFQRELE
jgi:hypothetical protein